MSSLSLVAAFLGGVLALLSPCSALLLPSFFAYAFQHRTQLLARTALFYIGLAVVLVPLGTGTSLVSHVFYGHRHLLVLIAGWMMIAFGAMQIIGLGFGSRTAQGLTNRAIKRGGWISMIALGAAYGLSGFCAGPILGSVLTIAAVGGQALHGAILLAIYALGMAAPLFLLAAVWTKFQLGTRSWLRGRAVDLGPLHLHTTSVISGLFFVAIGIVFLKYEGTAGITGTFGFNTTNLDYTLQNWLAGISGAASTEALLVIAGLIVIASGIVRLRRVNPRRRRCSDDGSTLQPGSDSSGERRRSDAKQGNAA